MPRYKLTLAYDGTNFHGWQKQRRPDGEVLRTVQEVLEQAVRDVVREPVILVGASRTDAGVHARGQVAAFTSTREIPLDRLPRAINGKLPDDVQVGRAEIVAEDFDPIRDASAKAYRYRIAHSCAHDARRPLFDRHLTSWTPYRLDPGRMRDAAQRLVGTHDFASFTRLHHGRDSTVRAVFSCDVTPTSAHRLRIDISGNGFLHNMIRIIAGTLIDVGRGKWEPDDIDRILAARSRAAAGATFTPEGLCLMQIKYPPARPA
jgi:tRNA pseudouridine38-40 synthase